MKNNFTSLIGISGKIGSGKDLVGLIIQIVTRYYDRKELYTDKDIDQCIFESVLNNRNSCKSYPSNWQIRKFADKLKDIVCLLIGCTREQLEDREFKEKELGEEWEKDLPYTKFYSDRPKEKLTPRKLLQLLGTECGRNIIHPNIWCNALFSEYKPIDNRTWQDPDDSNIKYPNWIITDTRFSNEANAIKERDGINIRVNRWDELRFPDKYKEFEDQGNVLNWKDFNPIIKHESEIALDNYQFDYIIDNNGTIEELIEKVKEILIKEEII